MEILQEYWGLLAGTVALMLIVILHKQVIRLFGAVIIPEDGIGIVNKKFVLVGKNKTLPEGRIVATNGEAGIQADTLAPGLHWGYWPWQYEISIQSFVAIGPDEIGIIEARDGSPIPAGRVLAKQVDCNSFQDVRKFLENGGQRGPQIAVVPPGTYRINTEMFSWSKVKQMQIADNMVGIVTTKEGTPLSKDEIAGPVIEGHESFQNAQTFLTAGGKKGLQEQVLLSGRYFINPNFATVNPVQYTEVPAATVGVVIALVGAEGEDVTGDEFKHGNLVTKGHRGFWIDPLDPGKYPINPFTHRVELVRTANTVLNWATGKTESHKLDENLSTIKVRFSDGFTANLDVSQIIHVPRSEASKVIARFGSMKAMIDQVLEPIISNYFRNAAQFSDVIDFLKNRSQRQAEAKKQITAALNEYNVQSVDTLIGDIVPPEQLMKTLTDRKLAEQEKVTYDTQRIAEETKKALEQARATAATQASVVNAERNVEIAEFNSRSAVKVAEGQAGAKTIQAKADAAVIQMTGEAEANKTLAIGNAEAEVTQRKIASMEAGNYASIEVARALASAGQALVPEMIVGGGAGGSDGLVSLMLAKMLQKDTNGLAKK